MWSGFNMLADLKYWNALPSGVEDVISRNVVKYVAQQRRYTDDWNQTLATQLAQRWKRR
jgi:TRAP-type C4-dicarboxylate transport system substrate-binding protein